jgi:D-alanyl-lipoteichoic acid acyltransferase DltB (MBOAT superfamily)
MFFNSLEFGLFFAIVFLLYLALPWRAQNRMLLLASYLFYAAWDWRFCSLLALSTVIDFFVGRALMRNSDSRRRRQLVSLSLVANLGILGFFKYVNFFSESLVDLAAVFGLHVPPFALEVILPVGISFYTFQTLSYTIDIFRRQLEPTDDFLDFALFVSFFPQLVAGPIERARHLLPQITKPRALSWEGFSSGGWLVFWGIFKKVFIADNLSPVVDAVFGNDATPTSGEIIVATWAFTYQIYCDFSGYTDIARGISRMLGFDLMLNFDIPYAAVNPADFWRRWHISLSTWLRDYVYIPLGGNRGGGVHTYGNLFITMLLGGIWHGAAWNFVIWGAYHGLLLIAHRLVGPRLPRISDAHRGARAASWALRCFLCFQAISFGLMIFRADGLGHVVELISRLASPFEVGMAGEWILPLAALLAPLIAMEVMQSRAKDLEVSLRWPFVARVVVYTSMMILIVVFGEAVGQPFVYFQF